MTDERVAWLTACLDELECTAEAVEQAPWMTLFDEDRADGLGTVYSIAGRVSRVVAEDVTPGDGALITLSDPCAVLARVEADRRILARHTPERRRIVLVDADGGETSFGFHVCVWCYPSLRWDQTCGRQLREWPCDEVLGLLAAHRHASGFQEEWLR